MSAPDVRYPVAHGLVYSLLEGFAAGFDASHFGSAQPHSEYVQGLPPHILGTHVNYAIKAEMGAHGGCGYAMLAGPGFGNNSLFAHPFGKKSLTESVVDLVGAGVKQVLSL